jgi:hypothetical protein
MRKLLVLLSAIALMVAFTVPASAADKSVSFYGQVWMDTYFEDDSKELTGTNFDDSDLRWDLNDNGTSRFGAKFKWDSMTANIEIRPYSASMYRQWWGSWNFGGGSLLVGHTWSPLYANATITNQSHLGGSASGYGFWVGDLRQAQIRLTMGDLILALVEPAANLTGTGSGAGETDTTLPKIEALYTFKLGSITLIPFFSYQTYDEVVLATDKSYGIDSMLYGLSVKAAVGPGFVKGQIWMNTNGMEWGDYYNTGGFSAYFDGSDIQDVDGLGFAVTAGMKLSDTMNFEVGYGHSEYEVDRPGTYEDEASAMYAQMTIGLAKGFFIVPEIGVIDKGTHTVNGVESEQGDMTYYGTTWKIYF